MARDVPEDEQTILDVFSGADGGGSYIMFRTFYDEMRQRADKGDADAKEIVLVVHRFARLLRLAARGLRPKA